LYETRIKEPFTIHFHGPPCRELKDMSAAEIKKIEIDYDADVTGRFEFKL
jgi:hypothetical protein